MRKFVSLYKLRNLKYERYFEMNPRTSNRKSATMF